MRKPVAGFIVYGVHKDGLKDPMGTPFIDDKIIADSKKALIDSGIVLKEHDVIVATKEEAKAAFSVMKKDGIVKINYASSDNTDKITVLQKEADETFKPSSMAILGKVNGNAAEIQSPIQNTAGILQGGGVYASTTGIRSIRWQQEGMEYAVYGNVSLDVLARFVEALSDGPVEIPKPEEPLTQEPNPEEAQDEPTIKVPVDLEVEKGDQKNVDAGHSPWKLDPVFVAQVFVSLQMSPEGIQGDYPIDYEDFTMVKNDGVKAIVETDNSESPVKRVYLERLVRQDETGIWTVVGYDPKEDA
jgi:hypothetical protein